MEKSILEELVSNGSSVNEIAVKIGKASTTIRYFLKKFNLKTNWRGHLKKIDDESLLKLANESINFSDFLRKISSTNSGGAHYHYKKKLTNLNFDFSKFKNGSGGKVTARKRNAEAIKNKKRQRRLTLKTFLLSNNIEYKCKQCGNFEWLGQKLLLHIHHIDSNPLNNILENLCFLCPNCHNIVHYDNQGRLRLLN